MAIGMILFWGAVTYGIVALARYARRDGPQRRDPPDRQHPDRSGCSPGGSPAARSRWTRTRPVNTAAVLDPVTKTLVDSARFANSEDGYAQLADTVGQHELTWWG